MTYNDFVIKLTQLQREYMQEDSAGRVAEARKVQERIQHTRYDAIMLGMDLYSLYRDVFKNVYGRPATEQEMKAADKWLKEVLLEKQLVDLYSRGKHEPAANQEALFQETQKVRFQLNANQSDVTAVSLRAQQRHTGIVPTMEDAVRERELTAEAIRIYGDMTDKEKKALAVPRPESDRKAPKISLFSDHDRWGETYSGADMVVFMAFPGYKPIEIGTLSTLSYTTYREKKQVRTLGRVSSKGITKGPRTISGRMIFTVIKEHIVETLRKEIPYLRDIRKIFMDELPSFDLLISFGNEYGSAAGLVVYGATTVDEQKTLSIEDLFTENIFTYLARDIDPMRDMNAARMDEPYDPLTWFSSEFKSPSESLGKFVIKEPTLQEEMEGVLPPANPNASTTAPEEIQPDEVRVGVLVYNYYSHKKTPIPNAQVKWTTQTQVTDKKGYAYFHVKQDEGRFIFSASADGYERPLRDTEINGSIAIPTNGQKAVFTEYALHPVLQENECTIEMQEKVGKVYPTGAQYEGGASVKCIAPRDDEKQETRYPSMEVKVFNECMRPIEGITVNWEYKVLSWDKIKRNGAWGGFLAGKVNAGTGGIGASKTDARGVAKSPQFDFGKFPEDATVVITAKARVKKDLYVSVSQDNFVKYGFYLQPRPGWF